MCVSCGATFDLSHDLLASDEIDIDELKEKGIGEREHYCWRCR